MIEYIDIDKIHPHPDNPRKNLGELDELAESIKESGILQNLTLIPYSQLNGNKEKKDEYITIIGHRRLAAAKQAGLKEVPCIIRDMDEQTQVATMLLENMQRSDLSAFEQAQGFQMMMDFGETVASISDKTGFSETTIRTRTKLLELDQEVLEKTESRNATMTDYIKLEKIKDIESRNKVLEEIGTKDFNYKLIRALEKQDEAEIKEKLRKELNKIAEEVDEISDYNAEYYKFLNFNEDEIEKIKEMEIEDRKYYFTINQWAIYLYREIIDKKETKEEKKERLEEEKRKQEETERKNKLNELESRTEKLREDFIYSLTNSKLKKHVGEIILLALEVQTSFYMWPRNYIDIFELEIDEEDFEFKEIEKEILKNPELSLLKTIYIKEMKNTSYINFRGEYSEDKALDRLYTLLENLGYKISKEEEQLKNGTHELFIEQDKEE